MKAESRPPIVGDEDGTGCGSRVRTIAEFRSLTSIAYCLTLGEAVRETGSPTAEGKTEGIEVFEYASDPNAPPQASWEGWGGSLEAGARPESARDGARGAVETRLRGEFETRLADEARKSFEAGRERGRAEGRQAERETQAGERAQRARQAAELVESFAQARERYLQAAEREVVELALAVAARILRREAQMDPLLLTGAVRVALGQISGSTQVRLRVPASELDLWSEAIALLPNLAAKPTVMAGEGMRLGDCAVETEMGSVDLVIRAQLGEIECGFFDRAGHRRSEVAAPAAAARDALREAIP